MLANATSGRAGSSAQQHTDDSATSQTSAPAWPAAGSLAGNQMVFFKLLPGRYLKLRTKRPLPASTISPSPPRPLLHIEPCSTIQRVCAVPPGPTPCLQMSANIGMLTSVMSSIDSMHALASCTCHASGAQLHTCRRSLLHQRSCASLFAWQLQTHSN